MRFRGITRIFPLYAPWQYGRRDASTKLRLISVGGSYVSFTVVVPSGTHPISTVKFRSFAMYMMCLQRAAGSVPSVLVSDRVPAGPYAWTNRRAATPAIANGLCMKGDELAGVAEQTERSGK